jgi:hypothetical protein
VNPRKRQNGTKLNFGELQIKGYVGDLDVHEKILPKLILAKYSKMGTE